MPVVSEEEEEGQGTSVDRAQDPPRACPYAAAAKIQNGSKEQNGGNLEEPCSVTRWDSEDQGIVGKETAEGSPPVSERDGELTDGMGQEGQEDGEGKAGVKMEGKGESYVLSLKVVLPGSSEPLTVMLSSNDTVQDVKQIVYDRQESSYRTSLSAQFEGKKLEDYLDLNSIEGLQNDSVIKFVEEPYTLKEVRMHICRFRDLMTGPQLKGLLNGTNTELSLSFLTYIMGENPEEEVVKGRKSDLEELANDPSMRIPPYCLPSADLPPLLPFYPEGILEKWPVCVRYLGYSRWNPPPNYRKLKGDLLYIDLMTLEGEEVCITACPMGFFVNKCQGSTLFDPTPLKPSHVAHNTLVALILQISPMFKKNFAQVQKLVQKRHPFENAPLSYPGQFPWLVPKLDHTAEAVPVEGVLVSRLGLDEQICAQTRDWNTEIQQAKDLSQQTPVARLSKAKTLHRIYSDFVHIAVKGVMNVIEGNISPLNPSDNKKFHIYLWNGIFFSLAFDSHQINYLKFGGDDAAHVASALDIRGAATVSRQEIEGLHTVETVVVDLKGLRVVAQAIVPGLLQSDPTSFIRYGALDNKEEFKMDQEFVKMLSQLAERLHIREHKVHSANGEVLQLPTSTECKGMLGTDGRYYMMDTYKLFPEDLNYMEVEGEESSKEGTEAEVESKAKKTKRPARLRHKLMLVRHEMVENFYWYQCKLFTRFVIHYLHHHFKDQERPEEERGREEEWKGKGEEGKGEGEEDVEELMNVMREEVEETVDVMREEEGEEHQKNVVLDTDIVDLDDSGECAGAGSSMRPEIQQAVHQYQRLSSARRRARKGEEQGEGSKGEKDEAEKQLKIEEWVIQEATKKAAAATGSMSETGFDMRFNVDYCTPEVNHADTQEELKRDRKNLQEMAQYLQSSVSRLLLEFASLNVIPWDGAMLTTIMHSKGINMRYLGKMAELASRHSQLDYVHHIAVTEMVLRATKRIFRQHLQTVPFHSCIVKIAHLLNCFLGKVEVVTKEGQSKKKSKKKKKTSTSQDPMTTALFWAAIVQELEDHFLFKLECSCAEVLCEVVSVHKILLLKGVCTKVGIQVLRRNYNFSDPVIFTTEDIAGLFPVITHSTPKPHEATEMVAEAEIYLQNGELQKALESAMAAQGTLLQIYGPLHEHLATCYKVLARIHSLAGQTAMALNFQQRAVYIYERVLGVDHRLTVTGYIQLAIYCQEADQVRVALRVMYRARYLLRLNCTEDHPDVATCDMNLAIMLRAINDIPSAMVLLQNSLDINKKYLGEEALPVAMNHHLLAQWLSVQGDFRGALQHEKAANNIFETQLGMEHQQTLDSFECIKRLTGKAVFMQKKIIELTGKTTSKVPSSARNTEIPGDWGEVTSMLRERPAMARRGVGGGAGTGSSHRRKAKNESAAAAGQPDTK